MSGILAAMCGRSTAGVSITDVSIAKGGNGTSTVTATYTLDNDGTVRNHNSVILQTWLQIGAASDYEARATDQSGTAPSGTLGSWLNLGTDRSWSLSAVAGAEDSGTFLIEIRDAATQMLLDSAVVTLNVVNTA